MSLGTLKSAVPWWAKIAMKLVFSRLPLPYGVWRKIGLFLHGTMEEPAYAYQVFRTHFDRCKDLLPLDAYTCMELGPGDTLFSALAASAHGASNVLLIDAGPYARNDAKPYLGMAQFLEARGVGCVDISRCATLDDILAKCRTRYLTDGLESMKTVPSGSVDWVWSQAVLEHLREGEFLPFMREMRRILKAGGIASHRIDLRDHVGGALNNLRFSRSTWEMDWIARAGFYTNRIRFSSMCRLFTAAGFKVEIVHVDRWPKLPTARDAMAPEFRDLPDDDLLVQGFDVLLRPA
jgi:SAM-dependent methyltransferase